MAAEAVGAKMTWEKLMEMTAWEEAHKSTYKKQVPGDQVWDLLLCS